MASSQATQDLRYAMAQFAGGGAVFSHQEQAAIGQRSHRGGGRERGGKRSPNLPLKIEKPSRLQCKEADLGQVLKQRSDS